MYRAVIFTLIFAAITGVRASADSMHGFSSRTCNGQGRCMHVAAIQAEISTDGSLVLIANPTLKLYNQMGELVRIEKSAQAQLDQELNILTLTNSANSLVFDQNTMEFLKN